MKIFSPTISGSSQASGSLTISGSLNVSQGITGSLLGTASWAINVVNGGGGSTNTGSLLTTASVNLNTITFTKGDGSTFPITINTGSGGGGSVGTLAQVTALGASTTTPITASIISASSFTGSLFGTASWALSASNAINARTASFVNNLNQNLSITGAVILSGSSLPELRVIGDTQFTGSINSLNGYTGSLFGTSSWATNALTASYILNAISSSFATTASHALNGGVTQITAGTGISINQSTGNVTITNTGGGGGATFPYTGSAIISGSLIVTGSTNSSGGFTGSLFGTASHAITASYALSSAGGGGGTSTPYCLGIFGGRYDWASGDNNERVLHGFVNGPTAGATANSEEFGTTIVGTIDVTTGSLSHYLLQYVGLYSPVGGIPNIKAWGRTSDADLTSAMSMSVSLWSTNEPANGFGTSTLTLRAQTPFLPFNAGTVDYIGNGWIASGSSERPTGSFYVVTFDLAGTITTTIQFYANFTIWID
jgi:hypothetical protein